MIKLYVEDYCQECKEFNPEVERIFTDSICSCTIVRCEYAEHCKYIRSLDKCTIHMTGERSEETCLNCEHSIGGDTFGKIVCRLNGCIVPYVEHRCDYFEEED